MELDRVHENVNIFEGKPIITTKKNLTHNQCFPPREHAAMSMHMKQLSKEQIFFLFLEEKKKVTVEEVKLYKVAG